MMWQDGLRRLRRYRDLPLLVRVFSASLKVSFSPTHSLIRMTESNSPRRLLSQLCGSGSFTATSGDG
jgi:hypothetical protein